MFLSVCDVGPLSILSQRLCSKCFANLGVGYGLNKTERNRDEYNVLEKVRRQLIMY